MYRSVALFLLLSLIAVRTNSQVIPYHAGEYAVAHHRLAWTDSSRKEILGDTNSFRRLIADVYYPTDEEHGPHIPYLDTATIRRALGNVALSSFFGNEAAALIEEGRVKTNTFEEGQFAYGAKNAPVIIFSHGMGMIPQAYTFHIEYLAANGYIVVALTHPHDAWLASFSDGTSIPFETTQRSAAGNSEEQHIAYENKRIEWWAGDIGFAIDQLTRINNNAPTSTIPFAGHMNLDRVGALGHSAGGRAAARACQLDARIKSCADQDGVAMMQPYYLQADSSGMKQPFLLMERVRNVAPDESDAASIGMTLPELNALVSKLRNQKEVALKATASTYHVLLNFDSSNHMSFSDLPILQANNEIEYASTFRMLQVICSYTKDFFDKTLPGQKPKLLNSKKHPNNIEAVRIYP